MDHNNKTLVQDFVAEPGVFFLGTKSLNLKSVEAARSRDQVLPIVGRHLFRQIYAETCWNGGRIDHSRSWMNFSLLPDDPMTSEAMVVAARAAVADNRIDWAKLRKDKIVGVEVLISLPAAFQGDVRSFFEDSLAWVRTTFPSPITIVAAIVHLDEANPHMHIILIPIVGPRTMDGHQVAGFKAVYNKRVNSFHQQVAQRYGLAKPRRKAQLTYRERQQLADRVLAAMMTDGPTWADTPAGVVAMRQMLISDPTPMAKALGLLGDADDTTPTAYAVAGTAGSQATAGDASTALLCYAVEPEAVLDGAADDRVGQIVEVAHELDGAHVLAGEAWLVLPTWQLSATCASTPPPIPQPIRLMFNDGASAPVDEAGDFLRVHEDEQPVECWDPVEGRMVMPPRPTPSARVRVDAVVAAALKARQTRST
jgi:hypothetical protein